MKREIDVTRDSHGQILYSWPGRDAIASPRLSNRELLSRLNKAIQADGRLRRHGLHDESEKITRKGCNLIIADLWKEAVNRGLMSPYEQQ
jgi:hypothetical protein